MEGIYIDRHGPLLSWLQFETSSDIHLSQSIAKNKIITMHLSILLGLAASSVFAASAPDNEIVRRAPLVKRNLAATSLNSLYARQALTCDFGYGICPDGITV